MHLHVLHVFTTNSLEMSSIDSPEMLNGHTAIYWRL